MRQTCDHSRRLINSSSTMSSGPKILVTGALNILQDLSNGSNIPALQPLVSVAVRIYTSAEVSIDRLRQGCHPTGLLAGCEEQQKAGKSACTRSSQFHRADKARLSSGVELFNTGSARRRYQRISEVLPIDRLNVGVIDYYKSLGGCRYLRGEDRTTKSFLACSQSARRPSRAVRLSDENYRGKGSVPCKSSPSTPSAF